MSSIKPSQIVVRLTHNIGSFGLTQQYGLFCLNLLEVKLDLCVAPWPINGIIWKSDTSDQKYVVNSRFIPSTQLNM